MQKLTEGKIEFYADVKDKISKELEVFYNPLMKHNRDITILLLKSIPETQLRICDPLAGSGIRSIRMLKELPKDKIESIHLNDSDEKSVEIIKKNLELNKLIDKESKVNEKVHFSTNEANKFLLNEKGFDYIDIDPFGSPNPFLNSAINRLSRNGILAITATDTAPLCGTYPKACERKYFAKSRKSEIMHETGLRILIRKAQLIAAQYERALIPIFSYSKDHYFRAFLRLVKGKEECDKVLDKHQFVLYCEKCGNFVVSKVNQGTCDHCKSKFSEIGPMWVGDIYDTKIAEQIVESAKIDFADDKELVKFLTTIFEESKIDSFGSFDIHGIVKRLKLGEIPKKQLIFDEIKKKKKQVSDTHFNLLAVKSDIGFADLIKILKSLKK